MVQLSAEISDYSAYTNNRLLIEKRVQYQLPEERSQSFGGAEEDRTPDLRIANATLSQLSYGPTFELSVYITHPSNDTTDN